MRRSQVCPDPESRSLGRLLERRELPERLCRVTPAPGALGGELARSKLVQNLVHVLHGQVLVIVVVDLGRKECLVQLSPAKL